MKKIVYIVLALLLMLTVAGGGGADQRDWDDTAVVADGDEIGGGSKTFSAQIVDMEGDEISITVHTDKETVGEALQELDVLQGEEGPYGLYIKAVNGQALDYDKDGAYWAFYVDGEYAITGVDETEIVETSLYMLKAEKG